MPDIGLTGQDQIKTARAKEKRKRSLAKAGACILSPPFFRSASARPRHAVRHGDVGAIHLLTAMRAVLVLFLVAAVSDGGFGIRQQDGHSDLRMYTAWVYSRRCPALDRGSADRCDSAPCSRADWPLPSVLAGRCSTGRTDSISAGRQSSRPWAAEPHVERAIARRLYPEGGAGSFRISDGVFYIGSMSAVSWGLWSPAGRRCIFGLRAGFAAGGVLHMAVVGGAVFI